MVTFQRLVVSPNQIQGTRLTLTAEQRHYLRRVLRLGVGGQFIVLDGAGQQWQAALTATDDQAVLVAPITPPASQSVDLDITLAAALPKQGFDQVVRQATELGVNTIVPILSERTLLSPSASKVQRWRRIATEAAEQCERPRVPTLLEPMAWPLWLTHTDAPCRLICVARGDRPSLLSLGGQFLGGQSPHLVIATGPEGGWTEAEIATAIAATYQPVSLGNQVLRALTAPVVALAVIQAAYGEWSQDAPTHLDKT
ncbi:MAG: 16S rRNA (uracil(1498)-N(3))-methyltransferase [Cyanobacteria bacterium]|nr:16S rRNA (uracil(1498)-N(3))-methyltransferase [Cyanobacteriota bacterium]MDA0867012.1 16S rRNA (uracil(1498)-N(3))-methyltransferase [Cyanobacteriota bacterium]